MCAKRPYDEDAIEKVRQNNPQKHLASSAEHATEGGAPCILEGSWQGLAVRHKQGLEQKTCSNGRAKNHIEPIRSQQDLVPDGDGPKPEHHERQAGKKETSRD